MKEGIHPQWYPEAEVVCDGEVIMTIGATQPKIVLDIWSGTHPFYTGQSRLIDTEGQVDRFMRRLQRVTDIKEDVETSIEEEKADPRLVAIEALELGERSENALKAAELTTAGAVLDLFNEGGEDALLALQGMGQTAVIAIKRYLRSEGLIE
ncbi:MAG: large subunit ribosomal protein L31 [Candidatus Promineifilaceae bacterium]|jgi:large subunit ribosomal protein L31